MTTEAISNTPHNKPDNTPDNKPDNRQTGTSPATTSQSLKSVLKHMFNWKLIKETIDEWNEDGASRLAASLAYYTVTALAQLLIGILAIVGFVYGAQATRQQLVAQADRFVGEQGGEIVQTIVENADQPELARLAGIFSLLLLLWSGSNVFVQLQNSLNAVWGVELRPDLPLWEKIKRRLMPLLVVAGVGVLVLAASVAGTALSAIGNFVGDLLPGGAFLWQVINHLITLAVITLLFALVFRLLPDVEISWRDVWPGAALTAVLFVIGQVALSWYLGRQSSTSVYGAAGSLIVLLLWIYYSAQIFLFGAEFTQVYATRYGNGVRPDDDAVPIGSYKRVKPAAHAAGHGRGQWQSSSDPEATRRKVASMARAWRRASDSSNDLSSLGTLALSLIDDFRMLARQEILLARAEIRETLARMARGAAMATGGGFAIYAAVLLLLAMVVILLSGFLGVWVAALLLGLLLLVEGLLLSIWARQKLVQAMRVPKQSARSLREDVETIKAHISN